MAWTKTINNSQFVCSILYWEDGNKYDSKGKKMVFIEIVMKYEVMQI